MRPLCFPLWEWGKTAKALWMRLPIACYLASPSGRGGRRQGSLTERVKQQLSQPPSPAACSISSSPRGSLLSYNSLKGLIRKSLATLAPFPHRKAFALQNHKAQSYNTVGRGLAPAGSKSLLQINVSEYPHIVIFFSRLFSAGASPRPTEIKAMYSWCSNPHTIAGCS